MGNKASNSSTATKGFYRDHDNILMCLTGESSCKESIQKFGNLTNKCGNEGDFISLKEDQDDPRDWNPPEVTPSKIFAFSCPYPSDPPPKPPSSTVKSRNHNSDNEINKHSRCPTSTATNHSNNHMEIPKIAWERVVMTPLSFPRSHGTIKSANTTANSNRTPTNSYNDKLQTNHHHHHQGAEGGGGFMNVNIRGLTSKFNLELLPCDISKKLKKESPSDALSFGFGQPRQGQAGDNPINLLTIRKTRIHEKGDANVSSGATTRKTSPLRQTIAPAAAPDASSPSSSSSSSSSSSTNETRAQRSIGGGSNAPREHKAPPAWLPDVKTSTATTNLRKQPPKKKMSILPFGFGLGKKNFAKFKRKKSPTSLSKLQLKYTLKSSKSSKLNFKSRSLTQGKSLARLHSTTTTTNTNTRTNLPSSSNASSNSTARNTVRTGIRSNGTTATSKRSSHTIQELIVKAAKGDSMWLEEDPVKEEAASSYEDSLSSSSLLEGFEKKKEKPKKSVQVQVKEAAGEKRPSKKKEESTSGSGSAASKSGAGSKAGTESGTPTTMASGKSSNIYGRIDSGRNRESKEDSPGPRGRAGPRKKIPPPPVFIGNYGCGCSSKKKFETPADRLKNVDIVEELVYNCPEEGDDDDCNDNCCCCCKLDYYACCNECGEMELVPQCTCCPQKKNNNKGKNPVRYCRRQRFNFDDGKNVEDDCDGPPFCWEDRPTNPYDEIPVGKNPVIGADNGIRRNGGGICCGGGRPQGRSNDDDGVMPAESGTYFFDAERRCFVPVVEVKDPPCPPSPEVVDEIVEEEPVLTNIEPIIQPVIQPMGGGCCCPGMGGGGMPFFGPLNVAGLGSNNNNGQSDDDKGKKDKDKKGGSAQDSQKQQMDNLGMMGLCGLNMNGLASMGPYGTMTMPIMKYQPPPCPCPPECPCAPCCPCPPQCGQAPCQPMAGCCNPICFPGYPTCPYPMCCNPCCNGGKKKKKGKDKSKKGKKKKTKDSSSGGNTNESTSVGTGTGSYNTGSNNSGSHNNDESDGDE